MSRPVRTLGRAAATGAAPAGPAAPLPAVAPAGQEPRPEAAPADWPAAEPSIAGLTPRELDVLREIAAGLNNREIAARLYLSEGTVKNHISRILDRLGPARPHPGRDPRPRPRPALTARPVFLAPQ